MKCKNCGCEVEKKAAFCKNCGNRIERKSKKIFVIPVLIILIIIMVFAIAVVSSESEYKKQIKIGYNLISIGSYDGAIEAFDKAIDINEANSEAYIGKATAMTYDENMDAEKAEKITKILREGYKISGDDDIIEYMDEISDFLAEYVDVNAAEKTGTAEGEKTEGKKPAAEENIPDKSTIYADFEKADEFWVSWIYGQFYVDNSTLNYDKTPLRGAVQHDEINTAAKLKAEIESHFGELLAKEYINDLNPQDLNGKLWINVKDGVGDTGYAVSNHSVEKKSDTEYILTLTESNVMDESQPDKTTKLLCTPKDGKWAFANYGSGDKHFTR